MSAAIASIVSGLTAYVNRATKRKAEIETALRKSIQRQDELLARFNDAIEAERQIEQSFRAELLRLEHDDGELPW